jgi:UDP-3-O-[3-hydroxymyristoyl] glucosamine N-acyltransferase
MAPKITTGQLAALLGGELHGDPNAVVSSFAPIHEAGAGAVTFISNKKYYSALKHAKATLVLAPQDIDRSWTPAGVTLLVHENPYLALARGMQLWFQTQRASLGTSERAFVAPSAKLGKDVNVWPFAYVGEGVELGDRVDVHPGAYVGAGAVIGPETILYPGAVIYPRVKLGARCIIHASAVVGADGFGFATDKKTGEHLKIPQVGTVVIEDDVEIGASTTIDRAAFGETRIGKNTKIDNLVQIGHNVRVGRSCFLVAQSGIAGTTRVGDHVTIAAQAGLVGHIEVGSRAVVGAQSGVVEDVGPGMQVVGTPAIEGKRGLRYHKILKHLPEMRQTIRTLERRVKELEAKLGVTSNEPRVSETPRSVEESEGER